MPSRAEPRRLMVLMAKKPEPGSTKTRLSPPLSPEQAAEVYRCFLLDKLAAMAAIEGTEAAIAFWPQEARPYFAALAPQAALLAQRGSDLAERLRHVFDEAFAMGYENVIALDGDTPDLPPEYLSAGFRALDDPQMEVVIGPCEDGGYYAIGMRLPHPTLFDVEMSTDHVTKDTLKRAVEAGLTFAVLPRWYDLDRPQDLARFQRSLPEGAGERAPATAAYLAGLGLAFEAP